MDTKFCMAGANERVQPTLPHSGHEEYLQHEPLASHQDMCRAYHRGKKIAKLIIFELMLAIS